MEKTMKIGIVSDLHIFNKTFPLEQAFSRLHDIDLLLLVGDIADRAQENQYDIVKRLTEKYFGSIPVYCVSGNHDNPARDDTAYRQFERNINSEYPSIVHECGAFYKKINDEIDLVGLNPSYHQKQFFFPEKGKQLAFMQDCLRESTCRSHIVMCHPPLIAHNPQRTLDMASYLVLEQDKRLQEIVDTAGNVIFLSGHTHVAAEIAWDEAHRNLYFNDGSICPVKKRDSDHENQQGNVSILKINDTELSVTIRGIYSDDLLEEQRIPRMG